LCHSFFGSHCRKQKKMKYVCCCCCFVYILDVNKERTFLKKLDICRVWGVWLWMLDVFFSP
jgi:hypothetical protein